MSLGQIVIGARQQTLREKEYADTRDATIRRANAEAEAAENKNIEARDKLSGAKNFAAEFSDIAYRHARGGQAQDTPPGLSTIQEPRNDMTLQEVAADPRWRPLLMNPKALQEIALSAAKHRQSGVGDWLSLAYKGYKGGVADAAEAMLGGDKQAAMEAARRGGMDVKDIIEVRPGIWNVRLGDGTERQFDPQDYLSNIKNPQRFLDRQAKEAETRQKAAESEATIKLRVAQTEQARSAAEYNRGARADLAAARAEAALTPKGKDKKGGVADNDFDPKEMPIERFFSESSNERHGKREIDATGTSHLVPTAESEARAALMSGLRGSNPTLRATMIRDMVNGKDVALNPADPVAVMKAKKTFVKNIKLRGEDGKEALVPIVVLPGSRKLYRADGSDEPLPLDYDDLERSVTPDKTGQAANAVEQAAASRTPGLSNAASSPPRGLSPHVGETRLRAADLGQYGEDQIVRGNKEDFARWMAATGGVVSEHGSQDAALAAWLKDNPSKSRGKIRE